ncbi:RNA polymerase sigma-70 factor [Foetidibacter luteolus]|uniref:RNA polymerase sigma-70 factor n=1 Tax=Foetidibacter luteolus TaxID=2608880 RepID=UPI00129A0D70|nr:RNA polymerase sigma-70 factor [Foetidibacter luteolus]
MLEGLLLIQQRIAHGEEQALAELYQHFHKKLQHFAKAIVRNEETAEELVEDVFVKLWCNRNRIASIENLTVYLYVAVKNKSLNTLSRKATELVSKGFDFLDIDIDDNTPGPQDLMITAEMMQRMNKAIDALPPRCKMIFKLVREDGLKYKEVAEILNISVNTIDAQMAIAVKRICTALNINYSSKTFDHTTVSQNHR